MKKILLIGFGAVGQTMLHLMLKHLNTSDITVIEKHDNTNIFLQKFANSGVKYLVTEITKQNLVSVLDQHVGKEGLVINLSLNINVYEIVEWCIKNNTLYTDTSLELWPGEHDAASSILDKTLYSMHQKLRELIKSYSSPLPTMLVTNGANPGLVNHFVKAALVDMANSQGLKIENTTDKSYWSNLCMTLGVKVIHISEKDNQKINAPKSSKEFINTWSVDGFWDEANGPVEIGWGTHEQTLPDKHLLHQSGSKSTICIDKIGINTLSKSWLPKGKEFLGYMIQHSESITLSEYFTVLDDQNLPIHRPTVYYVYHPTEYTIQSVNEFRGSKLDYAKKRIIKSEVVSGYNELGVLLLTDTSGWWYGSQLDIRTSNILFPGENPTTMQVAANMMAGVMWMLENPNKGYVEPEDLPYKEMIEFCSPYVSPIVSVSTNWRPGSDLQINSFLIEDIFFGVKE